MQGGIFLIQDGGKLVELGERPYEAEIVLQRLLADYPNILSGDQINPSAPRRWLPVGREAAIPSEEGGSGRWALDHLFLDQDAIPTFIEVKRSSDTRIRREVVGQMLDYAANALVYWPEQTIRAQFEATCAETGRDPNEALALLLEDGMDTEAFWQAVRQNLQAQRIRLVFVADIIPPELRRIVEFLNGQMNPAEVIAVEVRQFVGEGVKALVPQVVGQTAVAQQAKSSVASSGKRQWNEESFFTDLEARKGSEDASVARAILDWATDTGLRLKWGEGKGDGSFHPMVDLLDGAEPTISVYTYGRIEIRFEQLAWKHPDGRHHAFMSEAKREELRQRLNEVPGLDIPATAIARRPSLSLSALTDKEVLRRFLDALDWLVVELRAGSQQFPK